MDFTLKTYKNYLKILYSNGYSFQTFEQFIQNSKKKFIILRHDVDRLPQNSLNFAKIQNKLGIEGTYYFRMLPCSYDERIIREIIDLGHEIGYHYENMDICNGNIEKAWDDFRLNLDNLRKLYHVKTICMHGSPLSKFDNKDLWKKYDYKSLGIIAEPYYDVNFNDVLYLTDTGRRWNGDKVSVRDKVDSSFDFNFNHTLEIIEALDKGILPNKIMFTFHPQRWNDNLLEWSKELISQNAKNVIKKSILWLRNK
jgi:hypothetical protein